MVEKLRLTAVYEPAEDGWVQARIEEIPAVITAAPSRREAEELLLDALREYLVSFQEERREEPGEMPGSAGAETAIVEILLST